MDVHGMKSIGEGFATAFEPTRAGGTDKGRGAASTFRDLLGSMVEQSEAKQSEASHMTESLARGEPQEIHRVMSALNEADMSFRLVLEVRNKLVDAWQEIKRMPI